MESTLHRQGNVESSSPDIRDDNKRIYHNLRELVRKADSFHSNASTILGGGARSTLWGGSVIGNPLTDEQYSNIRDWITTPSTDEDAHIEKEALGVAAPSMEISRSGMVDDLGDDSDADSDIERHLTKKFEELAMSSLEQRDYPKAETLLKKVVDRSKDNDKPPEKVATTNLTLAFVYGLQGKWEDAEKILVPISMGKDTIDRIAFVGLQALAMFHLEKGDHDPAIRYCKRAVWGHRKFSGKKSPSYYESMALLAHIYDSNGNKIEAEVCRSFLPDGSHFKLQSQPSDLLRNALSTSASIATMQHHQGQFDWPNPPLRSNDMDESQRLESSQQQNMPQLIVGVDFGTTDTAIAFAYSTSSEASEHVVTKWPGSRTRTKSRVNIVPTLTFQNHC